MGSFFQTRFVNMRFIRTLPRELDDANSPLIGLFRREMDIVLVGLKPA